MKLFLIWADKGPEMKNLMLRLKDKGHEIVYWVGSPGGEKDKLPETIFHDHYEAWDGISAPGVDINEFDPPGKELIEKLYKTESLILSMMNRHFDKKCVEERRRIYYTMVRYWFGLIKKYKPETIIFPGFPHTTYNYIIQDLAKLLGLKTIMYDYTYVANRLIFYNDLFEGSREIKKDIEKNQKKNFSINDLSKNLQEYYKFFTKPDNDITPVYMKVALKSYTGLNSVVRKFKIAVSSIKDGTILKKTWQFFKKHTGVNLKKEYLEVFQSKIDFTKNFIYLPLCFQPESTSSPQGDMFVDQILMIEIVAASLPDNWVVYVKEHPGQWHEAAEGLNYSSSRYVGYYKRIAAIKNVYLIPVQTDTYKLIDKSRAVVVTAGTAGWEAILRSKPAIIFGYPWYKDCPCLFRVDDVKSCKNALKKIKDGFKVEQQEVINYLYSFDRSTTYGYSDKYTACNVPGTFRFTEKENMKVVTQKIFEEMEKM